MPAGERILVDGHRAPGEQRLLVGKPALAGKIRKDVRKTVGDKRRRAVHHVEVQMRRVGVAAIAEKPEHFPVLTVSPTFTRTLPGCIWA